ncbi:MAG: alpha/beta family hydrolase [Candidatus Zixiibacteriota bacterium]
MRGITFLFAFVLLFSIMFFLSCGSEEEHSKISTPRGVELETILDRPAGTAKFPAIVIAPGQGYHMRLSLFEKLAAACVQNGFVCLRFDWDFYTKGEEPSPDFTSEKEELSAAIDYLKALDFVDRDKIFICGKSIGALVGIDIARQDQSLKGLIILTFGLHPPRPPYSVWPKAQRLRDVKIPVQIVSGKSDPICRREVLDSLVSTLTQEPELVYVKGNHSLKGDTVEETEDNETRAGEAVIDFMRRNL